MIEKQIRKHKTRQNSKSGELTGLFCLFIWLSHDLFKKLCPRKLDRGKESESFNKPLQYSHQCQTELNIFVMLRQRLLAHHNLELLTWINVMLTAKVTNLQIVTVRMHQNAGKKRGCGTAEFLANLFLSHEPLFKSMQRLPHIICRLFQKPHWEGTFQHFHCHSGIAGPSLKAERCRLDDLPEFSFSKSLAQN